MKKIIFLLLFSISFLNAYSFYNGKCVDSYSVARINPTTYNLNIVFVDNTSVNINGSLTSLEDTYLPILLKYDGKVFPTTQGNLTACGSLSSINFLGMSLDDYNLSMAIYGILLSSVIAFGLIKAF
jgi:hypothetical protein